MLYDLTVVQFSKMLKNVDAILDKASTFAELKKIDVAVLLNSRLAPDQFNFIRQVQIACDSAKLSLARLIDGVESAPVHADTETTVAELKQRIESVLAYLAEIDPARLEGALERQISQPRWEGKYLNGFEYVTQYAIPNVYFHITTAYSILRHNGVEIGKKDFLGELPYKA